MTASVRSSIYTLECILTICIKLNGFCRQWCRFKFEYRYVYRTEYCLILLWQNFAIETVLKEVAKQSEIRQKRWAIYEATRVKCFEVWLLMFCLHSCIHICSNSTRTACEKATILLAWPDFHPFLPYILDRLVSWWVEINLKGHKIQLKTNKKINMLWWVWDWN